MCKLHLGLDVAACAEFVLFMTTYFLFRAFVQFVAVKAADFIEGMNAGVPAGQVWSRSGRVAFQAEHRLGLGWQLLELQERRKITDFLLFGVFDRKAAGPVT